MEEFIPIEIEFLAKADSLPREYREYFLPPLDDGLHVPAANRKVRDMEIQIFGSYIHIRICDHTESRVARAAEAVNYIRDVLTDQVVFCFTMVGWSIIKRMSLIVSARRTGTTFCGRDPGVLRGSRPQRQDIIRDFGGDNLNRRPTPRVRRHWIRPGE